MGKFDSKNKGGSVDVYQLIAQRNAAKPAPQGSRPQSRPQGGNMPRQAAAPQRPNEMPRQNAPQGRPQQPRQSMPQQSMRQPMPQQPGYQPQGYPRQAMPQNASYYPPQPVEEPRRRGPRLGSVIFYTIYFLFIFVFFAGAYLGLQWFHGWLVDFEAAQPTTKCEQVFEDLFSDPDWAALYDAAGISDTEYEGKDVFVAYMEEKVGDRELSYMQTSAGLSGNKKYIVKLDDEKIASFTLMGEEGGITDIPDWELGEVELFYQRNESFRIQKMEGHTAYVNGIALTDDFTIQKATTIAEEFLPMGTFGIRTCVQEISGLMALPTVTITDEKGNAMEVSYDAEKRLFIEQTEANTIGDEERTVALEAVQTYALFMIEKASSAQVAKYFDKNTTTYTTIVKSEVWWTQRNNGAAFSNESVSDYCRYTDDMFSVRVSVSLDVTRTDGTLKQFPVDTTLFFHRSGGKWLVFDMTNEDVMQPVGEVRLTFMNGDEVISTGFVSNEAKEVTTPMVTAPEGKVFAGWAVESVDEKGVKTLSILFGATENGVVPLPVGTILEPMVLHAHFENASEGGNG